MTLTPQGLDLVGDAVLGALGEVLLAVIAPDGARATAGMDDGFPRATVVDGELQLEFQATFGEDEANFEWATREIVGAAGTFDSQAEDHGRKSAGSVWTLTATIDLAPGPEGDTNA